MYITAYYLIFDYVFIIKLYIHLIYLQYFIHSFVLYKFFLKFLFIIV